MFLIKDVKVENNMIMIVDKYNKTYSVSLNDNRIANLLPLASNSSKKLNKTVRYFEKYFIICIICCIVSFFGIVGSLAFLKYTYDLFVLGYGLLGLGSISLAVISKLYTKWLKQDSINNQYWIDIYNALKNYNPDIEKCYQAVKQKKHEDNKNNIDLTYSYSKNDIIQDYPVKVKTKIYKKM